MLGLQSPTERAELAAAAAADAAAFAAAPTGGDRRQALKAISLGSGPHLALLRLINDVNRSSKTQVQTAARVFAAVIKEHPDDFSHFIHTCLTQLLDSPLTCSAWNELARKELKALYAEFYGYNVGIPLTPEGLPVRWRAPGWRTMTAAIADFGSTHGHPKNG